MNRLLGISLALGALTLGAVACGSDDSNSGTPPAETGGSGGSAAANGGSGGAATNGGSAGATQTLYDKYGGATTVSKLVDDAAKAIVADPKVSPYFAVVGSDGHDSLAHLEACLRLQFTVLLGGPGAYPGKADDGNDCRDMATAHAGLVDPTGNPITQDVFDQFLTDVAGVAKADGVSDDDLNNTIAPALTALSGDIVAK